MNCFLAKYYVVCAFLLGCISLTSQANVDSLEAILNSDALDRDRAETAIRLSKIFMGKDLDRVLNYAMTAERLLPMKDSLKIEAYDQLARYHFFKSNLDSASYYFSKAQVVAGELPNSYLEASLGNSIASVLIRQSNFDGALETLIESAKYFESIDDETNASKCYSNMSAAHAALGDFEQAIKYSKDALEIFRKNGLDQYILITLPNLATQHLQLGDTTQAITIFLEAERMAIEKDNKRSLALTYNNLGDLYLTHKQYEKAKSYIEKSIAAKTELNLLKGIDNNYHNLGYVYAQTGNHRRAISLYDKAIPYADADNKVAIYNKLKESYQAIGNASKALSYANLSMTLKDSLDQEMDSKNFAEISAQYETTKKENEILLLESENQKLELVKNRNRTLMFGALGLVFSLGVFGLMFFQNQKRKQLLANKEHELDQQRMVDEIQRKELESIDRIVQGQEDERNRISADLHDSLGSKMAALKLYVDELDGSENHTENSLTQVREIADEAYKEVRNMSHHLNSGVLIDKGLLPAIRKVAAFISDTKGLNIDVISMDMPERLDNKKEIQLFRIIQELLTNIVKHAQAHNATIQLAGHGDMLSVTVEDDGVGFNNENRGLGLENVDRRVIEISGNYEIDSVIGEGTSILLNIPI